MEKHPPGGGGWGNRLYLGVFYSGSFWANAQFFTSTEKESEWFDAAKRVPVYSALPAFTTNPSNQIAVLVGVADMGFRLSFRSTYQSFKEGNFAVGTTHYYKSHETETGLISPQIAWSMAKNLTANGIKPWATFDLAFNRLYTKTAEYHPMASGDWAAEDTVANAQNNVAPEFNVGLGGYTFLNKNNWRTSADMEYRLQITAYDNEYNYINENGENKIKSIKGTYATTGAADIQGIRERSFNGHRIRPSISTQWNGDKLRLRAKLDFNLLFNNTVNNPMAVKLDEAGYPLSGGDLAYQGETAAIFNFQFNPDLQLGAQWQAASRFFVNVGGRINLNALSLVTTEGKTYENGKAEKKSDYKTTATSYGATHNQLTLGVTLNATDNLGIEAATGLTYNSNTPKSANNLNVFDISDTGLFNFGSILIALKF
jgi:hypothetical protein